MGHTLQQILPAMAAASVPFPSTFTVVICFMLLTANGLFDLYEDILEKSAFVVNISPQPICQKQY